MYIQIYAHTYLVVGCIDLSTVFPISFDDTRTHIHTHIDTHILTLYKY